MPSSRSTNLDTPQRRAQLTRLVRNTFPGCDAVFVAPPRGGIAFRIRTASGRYRGGVIKLLSHHTHIRVNRAWLRGFLDDARQQLPAGK